MISSPTETDFRVGDVVRYNFRVAGSLDLRFVEKYGNGPFIIKEMRGDVAVFRTLSGRRVWDSSLTGDKQWTHSIEYLVKDEFLTAVRRAKREGR